jgi:hypothetical protein
MAPGVIILAGAPTSRSLDWSLPLVTTFSSPIKRFADLGDDVDYDSGLNKPLSASSLPSPLPSTSSFSKPSWRSLPLERQHLPTGHSQDHNFFLSQINAPSEFFSTDDVNSLLERRSNAREETIGGEVVADCSNATSNIESAAGILAQFYEQSYSIHEDIPSSQIHSASPLDQDSFYTTTSSSVSNSVSEAWDSPLNRPKIPVAGRISDLKDMPHANYLNSIQPQTMTVNLIVGVISVAEPRPIKTRRGADVELVEMLVGDESRSGFGVNFWVSSSSKDATSGAVDMKRGEDRLDDLKSVLSGLRPQDVVLIRNVALSSFCGKVYGQSLRKEMTKVHLLFRNRIDRSDLLSCYTAADLAGWSEEKRGEMRQMEELQMLKTAKVREWVLRFVGGVGQGRRRQGRRDELTRHDLPPDTQ